MNEDDEYENPHNPHASFVKRHSRPEDGIGYLTVTVTYESVDREQLVSSSHGFRVRKGPIMPKRTIIRSRVQNALDGVLDRIEQIEVPDSEQS